MRRILITTMAIMLVCSLKGQSSSDIYIIGTARVRPGSERGIREGFGRFHGEMEPFFKTVPISFILGSKERDYEMNLDHANYKNLARPDMLIKDLPLSQLSSFNVIDADEFIRTKTREQVWEWMIKNYKKKVWVIDRNDFYKSSPSLPANDRMKLIETEIWIYNIPDDVLNPI